MTNTLIPAILWTQKGCGPCIAAERMMRDAGLFFVKVDVSLADAATRAYWRNLGLTGTPIIAMGALAFQGADPDRIAALANV